MNHTDTRSTAVPLSTDSDSTDGGQDLLQRQEGRLLVLTLNRPQRRNALSPALYAALLTALRAAADDDGIAAVVLTGAGTAFCAGGDVARMAAGANAGSTPGADASADASTSASANTNSNANANANANANVGGTAKNSLGPGVGSTAGTAEPPPLSFEQKMAGLRRRTGICELLHTMPKPTIAMMRGPAVGAGLSLALACDLRYGDDTARLRTGFVNVGLSGDFGGHYFLPRLVGMAKARELYLVSPMLDAQAALGLGLLNAVFQPEALEAEVMGIARGLATGPRTAIAHIKANLNDAAHLSLPDMLDRECWRHARCTETPDHREAAAAFVEKRPPRFL